MSGPLCALRHAGKTPEPGLDGASQRKTAGLDLGPERRGIYCRFLLDFASRFGRFRASLVPLSFLAGRRLAVMLPPVGDRSRKLLSRRLSHRTKARPRVPGTGTVPAFPFG